MQRAQFETHYPPPRIVRFSTCKDKYELNSTYSDAKDLESALYQTLNAYNEKWDIWCKALNSIL